MNAPVSASHLSLWKMCKRREAFVYRLGLRQPGGDAAEAGKRVHAEIEGALREKRAIDTGLRWKKYGIGEAASLIFDVLPTTGILGIEEEFTSELMGISFKGVVDLVTADSILDHKSTSSLKYAKSVKDLELDVQRLIYTETYPDKVSAVWNYVSWKEMRVKPVSFVVDREKDKERFRLQVIQPAEEMLSVPQDVDPLSLEPTLSACKMFPPHGCEFKSRCIDLHSKPLSEMNVRMSRLLEKLNAAKAAPAPEQPATASVEEKVQAKPASAHLVEILFVDSIPLSPLDTPLVYATSLIAQAASIVSDDAQVPHHLLVDFGKGAHLLAAEVMVALEKNPVKYLYTETRSAEGKATLFSLMSRAKLVVRGVI